MDAYRDPSLTPAGTIVFVDGLVSEQGRALNSKMGTIHQPANKEGGRCEVVLEGERRTKRMKACHLKSIAGILRPNLGLHSFHREIVRHIQV